MKKVRALIIVEDKVLVVNHGDFYLLPGGQIEDFDQDEESAIRRELLEEMGLEVTECTSLGTQINNFSLKGIEMSEQVTLFKVVPKGNIVQFAKNDDETYSPVEWLPIKSGIEIFPRCVKDYL